MSDLISREAAIDAFEGELYSLSLFEKIQNLPSAQAEDKCSECDAWNKYKNYSQPELIRCKDCKHMIEHKSYGDMGESAYTCEGNMDGWVLLDSYCSYAERRTDG